MYRWSRCASAAMALVAVSACHKNPPQAPGPMTALEAPRPPAKVLVPVSLNEPQQTPIVTEIPPPPTPEPQRQRPTTPQTRPAEQAPATPAAEPPAQPVVPPSADVTAIERRIRGWMAEARRSLNLVLPANLDPAARDQYEMVQGYIKEAESALGIRNYMYAQELARKAAQIAGQLVKG